MLKSLGYVLEPILIHEILVPLLRRKYLGNVSAVAAYNLGYLRYAYVGVKI